MRRLFLLLTFLVFTIQFLSCSPTNPWENDDDSDDVSSVSAVNNAQVEVVFSTNVEESSAEASGNYSINAGGTTLAVNSAVRDAADNKIVRLSTASQENVEYTLIVTNVTTIASGSIKSKTIDTTNNPDKFTGDALFIVEGVTRVSDDSITINFSKTVDGTSGAVLANYSIDNFLAVTSASVSGKTVTLGTDSQVQDITYTISVNSVLDTNGNTIDPAHNSGTFGYIVYPQLVSATWQPNRIVDLQFSEPVATGSVTNTSNYVVSSGLSVSSAYRDSTDYTIVHIMTDYQVDMSYTIVVSGVTDIAGNTIDPDNDTTTFTGNASPTMVSIVVTDPAVVLQVQFSEAMLADNDGFGFDNYNNYSLLLLPGGTDETHHITASLWFDSSQSIIYIGLLPELPSGNHRLVVNSNVQDLAGNSLQPSNSIDFLVP